MERTARPGKSRFSNQNLNLRHAGLHDGVVNHDGERPRGHRVLSAGGAARAGQACARAGRARGAPREHLREHRRHKRKEEPKPAEYPHCRVVLRVFGLSGACKGIYPVPV